MRKTTSLHEAYIRGCRCATVENTKSAIGNIKSESLNIFFGLWVAIHPYETGVKSNRESARPGECLLSQVIYRPSRAEKC
jgi:hypothetical protein